MDPSSIHSTISSEIVIVNTQPHQPPANNITHMDVALYKAAVRGEIDKFSAFQGSQLESLLTPDKNTVLYVHLAIYDPFYGLRLEKKIHNKLLLFISFSVQQCRLGWLGWGDILRLLLRLAFGRSKITTSFTEQILSKCPPLLVQPNAGGQTPLHIAASNGHSDIVKFLINYKAKAHHEDQDQEEQGTEVQSVREMLRKTDVESNTALHVVAQHGHVRVLKELLEFEDPDFSYPVNTNQETPFYIAARRGYHSSLAMMLEKFKSPNHGGPHGRTVLHAAAMSGSAYTTRIILKKIVSLAKETDENGQTPLHYASHLGHYSVVKELLKWDKSAAYIVDTKWGMTPLLMAARQGHHYPTREIISSCPDCCEVVDKSGWNLFHFLAVRGNFMGMGTTQYTSIGYLKYKKDALGITPSRVLNAYDSDIREQLSHEKMLDRIAKQMCEDIEKEKEVAETPVRPTGDTKDALTTNNQGTNENKEKIGKQLKDMFLNGEAAGKPVRPIVDDVRSMEKEREAQLVVATLIATVTFAAAITVPGGYKSDKGPDQGTPFLIDDLSFKLFVISDALAFVFSLAAIVQFGLPMPFTKKRISSFRLATLCLSYAVLAMSFAFITGFYVVLQPSRALANFTTCVGLIFIYLFSGYLYVAILTHLRDQN